MGIVHEGELSVVGIVHEGELSVVGIVHDGELSVVGITIYRGSGNYPLWVLSLVRIVFMIIVWLSVGVNCCCQPYKR